MIDTLSTVEITDKKSIKKVSFSTFASKRPLSSSSLNYRITKQDALMRERLFPVVIQVQNTKRAIVRLDSMFIKCTEFDTNKTVITLNIYSANKLYTSSKIKLVKVKDKVWIVHFKSPLFFPADTSYIGFTITTKDNFSFYTNKKIAGYLYSYNKERDEFKILHSDDMPKILCPQIQIYYTKMD